MFIQRKKMGTKTEMRKKNAQCRIKREVMKKMRVKNARKSVNTKEMHEWVRGGGGEAKNYITPR